MALSANCVLIVFHSLDHRKLRTPTPESTVLHIGYLTRNVNEAHLKEIFGMYAEFFPIPMSSRQERVMEFFTSFIMCPVCNILHILMYGSLLLRRYEGAFACWCGVGNYGEVVNVELVMDHSVSHLFSFFTLFEV